MTKEQAIRGHQAALWSVMVDLVESRLSACSFNPLLTRTEAEGILIERVVLAEQSKEDINLSHQSLLETARELRNHPRLA